MRKRNSWLALLYGLTILVVPALHDHGEGRDEAIAVALAGCDDPSPHYAGHGAPELRTADPHCLACQYRADHQGVASRTDPLSIARGGLTTRASTPLPSPPPPSRPRCRAPPLA